jgi:predicted nicotinamide N-methyase
MSPLPSECFLSLHAPLRPVPLSPSLAAHQSANVVALWEAWEKECGREQEVPFWATVWPGAQLLALEVLERRIDVAGKRVLDIGCGGGVVSIAAAKAGALEVIANDIDPVALYIAGQNAGANKAVLRFDRNDLLAAGPFPDVDVIFAGDMFYNKVLAGRLLPVLRTACEKGTAVYAGEPGRDYAPKEGFEVVCEKVVPTDKDLEGVSERRVRILAW